jgi:hypothetical protein
MAARASMVLYHNDERIQFGQGKKVQPSMSPVLTHAHHNTALDDLRMG